MVVLVVLHPLTAGNVFRTLTGYDGRPSSRWFWMTMMAWLKSSASHPQASWPDFWGFVQGVFSFGNEKSIRKEWLATKRSTVDLVASKPCMKRHLSLFPAVLYMTEPWGATLKALSLSAAGEIMYPTTMQSFTVESSTNAYGGMGVNVPLGKNRDLPCFNHVHSHQSPCFLEFSWIFGFNWCEFLVDLAGLGPMRISMKRHSYDIYDSDVMKAAVSKLQTSVTTLETSQASGAAKAGKLGMCWATGGNSLSHQKLLKQKHGQGWKNKQQTIQPHTNEHTWLTSDSVGVTSVTKHLRRHPTVPFQWCSQWSP